MGDWLDPEDAVEEMDFGSFLLFCFLGFLIISALSWCCTKKRRGVVLSAPVVVTSATHTAPNGYTVTQIPPNATLYQSYAVGTPQPPYPTQPGMPMPMPVAASGPAPMAGVQHAAPYPPAASNMNPPPYEFVVAGNSSGAANNAPAYEKQAPYNPNYMRQ